MSITKRKVEYSTHKTPLLRGKQSYFNSHSLSLTVCVSHSLSLSLTLGVFMCVLRKIDTALAQVLYILFSYIQRHQIKQITQIKINKSTFFLLIIKINKKN